MNQSPRISVVCPTYNSENFVINTLRTVVDQISLPIELIVVDDGSTDNTLMKVDKFFKTCPELNTFLIIMPHKGPGAARNAGIKKATGNWIAFIDSDDYWKPNKLSKINETIVKHPEVNFIFHNENHCKLDGTKVLLHDFSSIYRKDEPLTIQLWRGCLIHTSTVVCKKKLVLNCGLYDERFMSAQDWELWIRMSPYIRFYHIRKVLGTYNDRLGNITFTKSFRGLLDELKILSLHKANAGASIPEYIYQTLRRTASCVKWWYKHP
jgi:glycosyltransferase involved in cell wall biosynthesis